MANTNFEVTKEQKSAFLCNAEASLQHKDSVRFKELQRMIPDISQKSLTQTLRTLEEDGFVHRELFPEVPPCVEYNLTERAYSLLPLART